MVSGQNRAMLGRQMKHLINGILAADDGEKMSHVEASVKDRVLTSVVAGVDANSFVAMLTASRQC